ncbi:MAG: hypothetical protein U0840_02265 [Gemmataceae bacterium]
MKSFVCVADEMFSLHNGSGPEAELFQALARAGFAGGRRGTTQQGYYYFTPSGQLLASDNSRDPLRVARMMDVALARWKALPRDRRLLPRTPETNPGGRSRGESHYPADGLVLRQFTRDLGASRRTLGDLEDPWNTDMVWISAAEVRRMVPATARKGDRYAVPESVIQRLARLHLVDSVLGQTSPFQPRSVTEARLEVEITERNADEVRLALTGRTRASEGTRSIDLRLLGRATFDPRTNRFTSFELFATGTRTGRQPQSYIRDEAGRGEIGFAFILAGDSKADKVAPSYFGAYGWR